MVKVQAIVLDDFTGSIDEHILEVEAFTVEACREALIRAEGGDDPWKILAMRRYNAATGAELEIDLESTLDGTHSKEVYVMPWGAS